MPHLSSDPINGIPRMHNDREVPMTMLASLLTDLASQHEQLGQFSEQLSHVISTVQATARQMQELLLQGDALPPWPAHEAKAVEAKTKHKLQPMSIQDAPLECEVARETPIFASAWQQKLAAVGGGSGGGQTLLRQDSTARHAANPDSIPKSVAEGQHLSAWELLEESNAPRARLQTMKSMLSSGPSEEDDDNPEKQILVNCRTSAFTDRSMDELIDGIPPPRHSRTSHESLSPANSLDEESHEIRRKAVMRLQARLGKHTNRGNVNGNQVHKAVTALGLVKYTLDDIKSWLMHVRATAEEQELTKERSTNNIISHTISFKRSLGVIRRGSRASYQSDLGSEISDTPFKANNDIVRFRHLAEVLLDDEALAGMPLEFQQISLTIREVLFSGDANRLVAELTNMRVDDVASPLERPDLLNYVEPLVGVVIVLNGIFIGFQSGETDQANSHIWFWGNVAFTIFFTLEISFRFFRRGCRHSWRSTEGAWNLFDGLLLLIAFADLTLEVLFDSSEVQALSVVRVLRLTRLTRLIRIFRLRYMKELSLMIKGLVGGLYTLFWAMVLLFFTIYIIAILAVSTIGKNPEYVPEVMKDELFSSVPRAFFTSFRCFMGDCVTSNGRPVVKLLSDSYGPLFILAYFASMIFVSFGLFNLIVAIYIENTLNAAKTEGEKTKAQRQHESIRIARLTRQLLKKFCAAQRLWLTSTNGEASHKEVKKAMNAAVFDDVGEVTMPVSKEMFLCIIQDHGVQKLMDDLDIPPDRANLFDILDADGSGGLEVAELITGLLRVRGEAKKSDVVGTLLGIRSVQDMIRELPGRILEMEMQSPQQWQGKHKKG